MAEDFCKGAANLTPDFELVFIVGLVEAEVWIRSAYVDAGLRGRLFFFFNAVTPWACSFILVADKSVAVEEFRSFLDLGVRVEWGKMGEENVRISLSGLVSSGLDLTGKENQLSAIREIAL